MCGHALLRTAVEQWPHHLEASVGKTNEYALSNKMSLLALNIQ